MAKVDTDYKKLADKANQLEKKLYDAGGMMSLAKNIKTEMDTLSKVWKDKEHYSHLNALGKEYETMVEYVRLLETYRKLLTDAASEYKKARDEGMAIAKSI